MSDQAAYQISLPYLAGLFDGEGCVGIYRAGRKAGRMAVRVEMGVTYLPVLTAIQEFLGYGQITPRGGRGGCDKQLWRYGISDRRRVLEFLKTVEPYLHEKREQVQLVLDHLERGLPDSVAAARCREMKRFEFRAC